MNIDCSIFYKSSFQPQIYSIGVLPTEDSLCSSLFHLSCHMLERGFWVCSPLRDIFHTMASTTPVLKQTSMRSERLSLQYSQVKHRDFKCPKYLFKLCHVFWQVIPWKKSHTLKILPEHFRLRSDSSSFVRGRNTQQSKESEKQIGEWGQRKDLYVSTHSKPHYF